LASRKIHYRGISRGTQRWTPIVSGKNYPMLKMSSTPRSENPEEALKRKSRRKFRKNLTRKVQEGKDK